MAPGDFLTIDGRQRAVRPQPRGQVLVAGTIQDFNAVIIEAGTAVREPFFMLDDSTQHHRLRIPIMVIPAGATIVKTVAMAAPATIWWDEHADHAIWGVDAVHVEEDTTTRELFIVADIPEGGEGSSLGRIAYHITIFIQAPNTPIQELDL